MVRKTTKVRANRIGDEDDGADHQQQQRREEEGAPPAAATEVAAPTTAAPPAELTEEQMRENIRQGAQGLRDLVDTYQEQHRVMQAEVAEAIIRDVQEQNQLHRLTAHVLRQQQAALSNPEYTRWAHANRKGEFGDDYRDPRAGDSDDDDYAEESERHHNDEEEEAIAISKKQKNKQRRAGSAACSVRSVGDGVSKSAARELRESSVSWHTSEEGGGGDGDDAAAATPSAAADAAAQRRLIRRVVGDVLGNSSSGNKGPRKARDGEAAANRFDAYVAAENRWMAEEVRAYHRHRGDDCAGILSSAATTPAPIVINLDAVNDRQALSFIKGNVADTASPNSATAAEAEDPNFPSTSAGGAFASRVPLPAGSVLAPPVPPRTRAVGRLCAFLREAFLSSAEPLTASSFSSPLSSFFYVPYLNGSVLWPLASQYTPTTCTARGLLGSQARLRAIANCAAMMDMNARPPASNAKAAHRLFATLLFDAFGRFAIQSDPAESEGGGDDGDDESRVVAAASHIAEAVAESLADGDGRAALRDEGNLLVFVPMRRAESAAFSPAPFVVCRAFSFKGITKAIEVSGAPHGMCPFVAANDGRNNGDSLAAAVKRLVVAEADRAGSASLEEEPKRPTNIVRTFIVPLSALSAEMEGHLHGEGLSRSANAEAVVLIDARTLSPSIPLAAESSGAAFSWTDLCGLARADVADTDAVTLRMPPVAAVVEADVFSWRSVLEAPFDAVSAAAFPKLEPLLVPSEAVAALPRPTVEAAATTAETNVVAPTTKAPIAPPQQQPESTANSNSKGKIEVTPALLAGLASGVAAVAVCCTAAGYWLATSSRK